MKNIFLLSIIICAYGSFTSCTSDDTDYTNLIVGRWLPEYAYRVNLESGETTRYDYGDLTMQIVGVGGNVFDTILVTPDKYVTEFRADGTMHTYKFGEDTEVSGNPRTYCIEDHQLIIQAIDDNNNTEYKINHTIQTLNQKILDIFIIIDATDETITSPEPPEDTYKAQHHVVYKRL